MQIQVSTNVSDEPEDRDAAYFYKTVPT